MAERDKAGRELAGAPGTDIPGDDFNDASTGKGRATRAAGREAGKKLIKRCRVIARAARKRMKDEHLEEDIDLIASHFQSEPNKHEREGLVVRVNKLYPTVRLGLAGLGTKAPEIIAVARNAESMASAPRMTAAQNYNTREMNFAGEVRDWLVNYLSLHYSPMKFGTGPGGLGWWEAVGPLSVLTDPALDKFDPPSGRWLQHTMPKSIAALRAAGRYPDANLDQILDKVRHDGSKAGDGRDRAPEESIMVWIRENYLWEGPADGGKLLLVAECVGFDSPIREVEEMDTGIGFPIAFLYGTRKIQSEQRPSFFPIAEPMLYMEQMAEINMLRSKALVHASRSNVRIVVSEQQVKNTTEIQRFSSSEPYAIIHCKGDVDKAAKVLDTSNLGHLIYRDQEIAANQDIYETTGYGSRPREQSNQPSSPATGLAIDQQNMIALQTDREGQVQRALVFLYERNGISLQKNLTQALSMAITNSPQPVDVRGAEDIQGSFSFEYHVFNAMAKDKVTVRKEATELFTTLLTHPLVDQLYNLAQYLQAYDRQDIPMWLRAEARAALQAGGSNEDALAAAIAAVNPAGPGAPPGAPGEEPPPGPGGPEAVPQAGSKPGASNLQGDVTGQARRMEPLDFAAFARELAT